MYFPLCSCSTLGTISNFPWFSSFALIGSWWPVFTHSTCGVGLTERGQRVSLKMLDPAYTRQKMTYTHVMTSLKLLEQNLKSTKLRGNNLHRFLKCLIFGGTKNPQISSNWKKLLKMQDYLQSLSNTLQFQFLPFDQLCLRSDTRGRQKRGSSLKDCISWGSTAEN